MAIESSLLQAIYKQDLCPHLTLLDTFHQLNPQKFRYQLLHKSSSLHLLPLPCLATIIPAILPTAPRRRFNQQRRRGIPPVQEGSQAWTRTNRFVNLPSVLYYSTGPHILYRRILRPRAVKHPAAHSSLVARRRRKQVAKAGCHLKVLLKAAHRRE